MSYCRWGADDGRSDVYCYANCSGKWTTHVAGQKPVALETKPPAASFKLLQEDPEAWQRQHKAEMDWYKTCTYAPLNLPYDGQTFDDDGPAEMVETLLMLRAAGYHVPEYAIEALREEASESGNANQA